MKKLLLMLGIVSLLIPSFAFAQTVTTIANVQDTTGTGSADSPFKDQVVTVEGIVSAESWAFGGTYFIQDGSGPWSGVMVYDKDHSNAYGDSIRITGTVVEYYGVTEIKDVTEYVKLDSGKTVEPTLVTTGEIGTGGTMSEAYEGVLVQVQNVEITDPDLGYGEWEVNDGSGPCRVDDKADYYYIPANYDSTKSITGVLTYSYGNTLIWPRLAYDVVETGKYTRIQRIQQVRYSDLLKTENGSDEDGDWSYFVNDTVTVKGVVTTPTDPMYAGAGVKFCFQQIDGGPWSGLLSYNPDSTAYPTLWAGDVIEMTGYIFEYSNGAGSMTEFWITSPLQILDWGQAVPPVDTVATIDLRTPTTAEKWGTVIVAIKDAYVTDHNQHDAIFSVDDGSGEAYIYGGSDSTYNYVAPPLGTFVESISGWLYHNDGNYADSTTYRLGPIFSSDIVLGKAPPAISETKRTIGVPTTTDAVEVTTVVTTSFTITNVDLFYRVDGGAYQVVPMTVSTGDNYTGTIPAQALGSFVDYYIKVTDSEAQESITPSDTSLYNYCYPVTDGNLTISDVQYTPWQITDSPFEGAKVTLTGIVTSDSAMNNNYYAYSIQDGTDPYDGIWIFDATTQLRGNQVEVHGTVTDYNPDWGSKWNNNTVILVDSVKLLATGQALPATSMLTTGDLSNTANTAEGYEGMVVRVEDVTISSINAYDFTVDDGSGPCLVDDDGVHSSVASVNSVDKYVVIAGDTLRKDDVIDYVQGIFTFSFGTYKIELRDADDAGIVTGVNENTPTYPLTYNLEQNYPNPFNPGTRVSFSIPKENHVKIVVYNSLGQMVRILVDEKYGQGHHIINWNGRNQDNMLVPTGMYFYRMQSGDYMVTKKMMLLK